MARAMTVALATVVSAIQATSPGVGGPLGGEGASVASGAPGASAVVGSRAGRSSMA